MCCFASVAMIALLYVYRYIVVLNGKETLNEALVKHSLAFSDRAEIVTNKLYFNKHAKGKMLFGVITSCKFIIVLNCTTTFVDHTERIVSCPLSWPYPVLRCTMHYYIKYAIS